MVQTNEGKSFIHFYGKMLSVKLQREKYETIISGKLLEEKKGWCLVMNRWSVFIFFLSFFFPPRFVSVFIRIMTGINQHECLALANGNESESFHLFSAFHRRHNFSVLLPSSHALTFPRVQNLQIYIFLPSSQSSTFLPLFSIFLRFCAFVKYCYCC